MALRKYLEELNEKQLEAVINIDGPSLIIAGAGSGKTKVLTTRIAFLLDQSVDAFSIMALTFTNKASREMRNRIEMMVGKNARDIWMGTFHSVFARILRSEAHRIGFPVNFTIYDTDDAKSVIKAILKEEQLDSKLYNPSFVYHRISSLKNNLIKPQEYIDNVEFKSEDLASGRPRFGEIYMKYNLKCFKSGAMDFDDLLVKTYDLLNKNPDVLLKYQHHFKYLLIDEFQDTNLVQYWIVRKLAASHRNLCVVGDDSQSIYSFRGANIKNILEFEKDYSELKVFRLEQNYRSTKNIVSASDTLITKNKFRLPKNLWTDNIEGNKIKLIRASSESDEGNLVAQAILNEKSKNNYANNDIVILYRTNAQSRAFEESLRRFGIDYRLIGSLSFYQRAEIKDILAYCRLVLNPADEESLKRIINYPARGIGDTTFSRLLVWANDNQCSVWDIVCNIRAFDLAPRFVAAIDDFANLVKSFQVIAEQRDAYEASLYIAKESGIIRNLAEDKSIEGIGRYENLQNLLSAIKDFISQEDRENKSLGDFLQEVSLLTDADSKKQEGDKVTMMTVHMAKGLEYQVVFVAGVEENLFPSQMSLGSREEIEEERRLFYVAMTRAKQKLFISYAASRFKWGNLIFCEPSRFIDEVDGQYLEYDTIASIREEKKPYLIKKETSPKKILMPAPKPKPAISPDFIPEEMTSLKEGMQVDHGFFGIGKVLAVEGAADSKKATIIFENFGEKQILLKFAKMKFIR